MDDVDCFGKFPGHNDQEIVEYGYGTPYEDNSDDEDDSFDEGSDGELVRHNDGFPVFRNKGVRSVLCLGMKFSDKRDFKEAVKACFG